LLHRLACDERARRPAARRRLRRRPLRRARVTESRMEWPEPVDLCAACLRETGAEARIEERATPTATAQAAADAVGCTLGQVVTSVVLLCDASPVVPLVPGDRKIDTGKIARLVGAPRAAIDESARGVQATGTRPRA